MKQRVSQSRLEIKRAGTLKGEGPRRTGAAVTSERIAALNDPDEHQRDGDDEQDVDEPAKRVRADHAEQPQDYEQDENRGQHVLFPPTISRPLKA